MTTLPDLVWNDARFVRDWRCMQVRWDASFVRRCVPGEVDGGRATRPGGSPFGSRLLILFGSEPNSQTVQMGQLCVI